eukprot:10435030-Alexandrium_andersonii.AAC.1
MSASLVGSEMCIRDSSRAFACVFSSDFARFRLLPPALAWSRLVSLARAACLLYTSDAADDM